VGNSSQTLADLSEALLDYLTAVGGAEDNGTVEPVVPEDATKKVDNVYSGIGFRFDVGATDDRRVTALMVDIWGLFERVYRYTSQKSRFIAVGGERETANGKAAGSTNVDLYAFTPDEADLYRQFLKEAAGKLWELLVGYSRDLPFKGCLFDEGVSISEQSAEAVGSQTWPADSFVRVDGRIYKALQDVPAGTEITDTDYWKEVSGLYDTLGKVVYFVPADSSELSGNRLVALLHNVEDFLYAFVLWRWYVLAGLRDEAQVWSGTMDAAYSGIKGSLLRRPVLRRAYPF
jgi:hypothetical protein